MSRIGKKPITVPSGVTVSVMDRCVTVKGPKGELSHTFPPGVSFSVAKGEVNVSRGSDQKRDRAMHGTARALARSATSSTGPLVGSSGSGAQRDRTAIALGSRVTPQSTPT